MNILFRIDPTAKCMLSNLAVSLSIQSDSGSEKLDSRLELFEEEEVESCRNSALSPTARGRKNGAQS